ncbi:MAG: enoyl-CoA hydratase/isomerase family protein [Proteobacteria bacterium]|nr:enoyl-CoA hydratase/isomerase family protein [Pseudomonadota bacterium]
MSEAIRYEKKGDIGKITLNNPDKANPFSKDVLLDLIQAFVRSRENQDVCVIYGAEGKNFTFGADLKYGYELMSKPERRSEATEYLWSWQELTGAMLEHPGIIIVGYHGWIVGGGFEHTLACDLRIAADNTRIMLPELDMGIFFSNASTRLLPQIVGAGRAKELMIMGGEIGAEEALRIGLVNRVCQPDELNNVLQETAEKIVSKDRLALQLAKKLINEAQENTMDDVLYKEGRAMILTGQSGGAEQRIKAFLKMK